MFRKSDNQGSLLEVDTILPGALPANDWSYTYREKILPLIDEEKFRCLFASKGGSPNKSIRTSISLLIFMGMEKHTWRGAEFQFPRRLDWMNATRTPLGEASIDHTTLFKFFGKLENNDIARSLFMTLTNDFIKRCGTSVKKQRTDSFFIHGWLQTLSRYQLFKETIRVFLSSLKKQETELYNKIASQLSKEYIAKKFDLTEKDKSKAKKRIKEMAYDMYYIKQEFFKNDIINKLDSFKTLIRIFAEQCDVIEQENKDDKKEIKIEIKEKPEARSQDEKIISTPHNTEAEYAKKNKQKVVGNKGFITETCDSNNKTQFFTDASVTGASKHDSKELDSIQDRLDKANILPDEQYSDAGFVNGETILSSKDRDVELEGPSSGRSQSIEGFNEKDRPLDVADFKISINDSNEELTVLQCPKGEIPIDQKRSEQTGKINVHFDAEKCSSCSCKSRCPIKVGKKISTFIVDEVQYIGALRHHKYMEDQNYRKQCATRAGIEGAVNEIANAHGMRKAKHRKKSRIGLQMIFAIMGCNVKRFIGHGEKYAYL